MATWNSHDCKFSFSIDVLLNHAHFMAAGFIE